MKMKWFVAVALAVGLLVPAIARAHDGHEHKVMGTVSSVQGNNLMVKTADGKSVMVMLDAKTKITRGKAKAGAADVKVGDRVVATGLEQNEMINATTLQLGTQAAPAAKKAGS